MESKFCRGCQLTKPWSEFYGNGYSNRCKECTKAKVRANRQRNADYYRNYDRLRYDAAGLRSLSSNDNGNLRKREWARRNRQKTRAQGQLQKAIDAGIVARPIKCDGCGLERTDIEAHHDDYSKPFQVKWLCTGCHGKTRKKPRVQDMAPPIGIGRGRSHRAA